VGGSVIKLAKPPFLVSNSRHFDALTRQKLP
jgi:hypothetical protein